ncbi:BpuSI family type II restriction endonuclease [Sulfitobacter sp. S190]|uniref:BpuSI family type II restriction endonuclease n=1 Tax=Sulfitobacter sp. S190 TaxID=2867022 RepID=UPI0021A92A46|nr:BpuSI family type II restriction endonuclease [Sulfitobacter sp. S190]UWR21619.1 BpuSI family type II restriction endonuclease [Sulfitobacter sp. S190]
MSWLSYASDEVGEFHPEFQSAAEQALFDLNLSATHHWRHHPVSMGVGVVPDYVLVESASGRWMLIVEIKRRPDAVKSERNQIQAKGYAEANASYFRAGWPQYFCVTNLEITQGFALRGGMPPRDCLVDGMQFDSGTFASTPQADHRRQFIDDLKIMISHVQNISEPTFTFVWPRVVRGAYQHAEGLPFNPTMDGAAGLVPDIVRDYFSIDYQLSARRQMLIRCLMAEYLRGLLRRHDHPQKNSVGSVGTTLAGAANALVRLRSIDFAGVFEDNFAPVYLGFEADPSVRPFIEGYLAALQVDDVTALSATRSDSHELPERLIQETAPAAVRDARGKAATDPELAALLVSLTVTNANGIYLDPGCGEGNLISAIYDWLRSKGVEHDQALGQTMGIEADSLAAKVAALRLVLKEPRLANHGAPCRVEVADMFSSSAQIALADAILMNPPFKRYEVQDDAPIPAALRQHYRAAIAALGGQVEADGGQSNIYALYIEYLIKAAKPGATIGIVLDNKWFHNETARPIRELLLRYCEILGVVTYPHSRFFEELMIATSMVIVRKGMPSDDHSVCFARVEEPGATATDDAANAIRGGAIPNGWSVRHVRQSQLGGNSWKSYLSANLVSEFRQAPLAKLPTLFTHSRRGGLAKEGGGIAVYEFPERTQYGPKRQYKVNGNPFQTEKGRELTKAENDQLRALAGNIPDNYRGYAINKADRIAGYNLSEADVTRDWTLESPSQRTPGIASGYAGNRRRVWDNSLEQAVASFRANAETQVYIEQIEQNVGLDDTVLPNPQLWNALREPFAGGLIIPRKQRVGHRVHINGYAFAPQGRQVRLSSNFLSYGGCTAIDPDTNLDESSATRLIAAWLLSSFGHLQFELESNNREGARSLEQHHADSIWIFDPRLIQPQKRTEILDIFARLPFPVRTDIRPELQPELMQLDRIFSDELARVVPNLDSNAMLLEVWDRLHDLHDERNN